MVKRYAVDLQDIENLSADTREEVIENLKGYLEKLERCDGARLVDVKENGVFKVWVESDVTDSEIINTEYILQKDGYSYDMYNVADGIRQSAFESFQTESISFNIPESEGVKRVERMLKERIDEDDLIKDMVDKYRALHRSINPDISKLLSKQLGGKN